MPNSGGIIGQPCRRRHQSAADEAAGGEVVVVISNGSGEDKPAEWTRGRSTGKLHGPKLIGCMHVCQVFGPQCMLSLVLTEPAGSKSGLPQPRYEIYMYARC